MVASPKLAHVCETARRVADESELRVYAQEDSPKSGRLFKPTRG